MIEFDEGGNKEENGIGKGIIQLEGGEIEEMKREDRMDDKDTTYSAWFIWVFFHPGVKRFLFKPAFIHLL